jgi:hypothetical protein
LSKSAAFGLSDGVVQPIMAPKEFLADDKGRRAKNPERARFTGRPLMGRAYIVVAGARERPRMVLPSFA